MIEPMERRVPYGIWVAEEGGIPSFFLAHSLTRGGLRLLAKHPPRTRRPLQMRLLVENERHVLEAEGEVVDSDVMDEEGFTVRFQNLDGADQAFLDGLLDEAQ